MFTGFFLEFVIWNLEFVCNLGFVIWNFVLINTHKCGKKYSMLFIYKERAGFNMRKWELKTPADLRPKAEVRAYQKNYLNREMNQLTSGGKP